MQTGCVQWARDGRPNRPTMLADLLIILEIAGGNEIVFRPGDAPCCLTSLLSSMHKRAGRGHQDQTHGQQAHPPEQSLNYLHSNPNESVHSFHYCLYRWPGMSNLQQSGPSRTREYAVRKSVVPVPLSASWIFQELLPSLADIVEGRG
jgi:hypothetical protein